MQPTTTAARGGFLPPKKKIRISSLNSTKKKICLNSSANNAVTSPQRVPTPRVARRPPKEARREEQETEEETPKVTYSSVNSESAGRRVESQSQEFERLLQITHRCLEYSNKFSEEKDIEVRIVK
jgi:hypothetical protein